MLPLQVIDKFLLNYEIGQVLLLALILATLGALPLKSRKVLGLNFILFGVLFLLTPQAINSKIYLFAGIALVVIGPILYSTARN